MQLLTRTYMGSAKRFIPLVFGGSADLKNLSSTSLRGLFTRGQKRECVTSIQSSASNVSLLHLFATLSRIPRAFFIR